MKILLYRQSEAFRKECVQAGLSGEPVAPAAVGGQLRLVRLGGQLRPVALGGQLRSTRLGA